MSKKETTKKILVRSDYRMIRYLANSLLDNSRVVGTSASFGRVENAFRNAGGSWEKVFTGSVRDLGVLRQIIDYAIKNAILKKTSK